MDIVDAIRWLFAVPLGLFGLWVTLCNYGCIVVSITRGRNHSTVPLIGGGSLSLAWLLCPALGAKSWAWIPLVIDPACALVLTLAAAYGIVRLIRGESDALDNSAATGDDT